MTVAGDIDDRVDGAMSFRVWVGGQGRLEVREQRGAAPTRDEDAVAVTEPALVRVVEALELDREIGDVAVVVALLAE